MIAFLKKLIELPKRILFFFKRCTLKSVSFDSIKVGFGDVLKNRSLIHGGAVKLLPLREAMGGEEKKFNLLYLVSSAQPCFAEDLVKLCHRRGIPFVWNQNGVGYPAWAGNQMEYHNAPMRRLRQRADYIIYQSLFCRDSAEKFLGPCSVPSEVLLNPVNIENFFPLENRPSLETLKLLTLGTHGYPERVLSTLKALKILRDQGVKASLTIAGRFQWSGGDDMVRQKIEKCNLVSHVTLLPAFSQAEAVALYQSHHLVLHPKYLDPCPTVVAEALASGCPVVGSASGGVPEMVSDDCSYLVPAEEQWEQMITPTGEELATGVMTILPHFEAYAHAARARAEQLFDQKKWVARHREIFEKLLKSPFQK